MRPRRTLCVATAQHSCDVDASRLLRAPQDKGECRGRLFLGYFLLAKQKEVTAARHERDGGKRFASFRQTLQRAQGERVFGLSVDYVHPHPNPLPLAGEGTDLRFA